MSTFYIHVRGPDYEGIDFIGRDFADTEAACGEALRAARELLVQDLTKGKMPPEEWIEVEDENHRLVMTLPLSQVTR